MGSKIRFHPFGRSSKTSNGETDHRLRTELSVVLLDFVSEFLPLVDGTVSFNLRNTRVYLPLRISANLPVAFFL